MLRRLRSSYGAVGVLLHYQCRISGLRAFFMIFKGYDGDNRAVYPYVSEVL